jgi:RimJ/RimL family protein N-acetyltransferase
VPATFSAMASESSDDVALLAGLAAAPDRWAAMIAHGLRERTTRPEWLWRAHDGEKLVAAAVWWSADPDAAPEMVDVLGETDPASVAGLLEHSRQTIGAEFALCSVQINGQVADLTGARPALAEALRSAGFTLEVKRVRVEWTPASPLPTAPREPTMRAAITVRRADLIELFAAVADHSLDHHMIAERERSGVRREAELRLQAAFDSDGPPDWFTIGVDHDGSLVGYVVPALVNGDRPIIAELGVAADHRGHRYGDALLAHATRLLAHSGAAQIRADTDLGNHPMRAAFARAGYTEFARRFDYTWRCGRTAPGPAASSNEV